MFAVLLMLLAVLAGVLGWKERDASATAAARSAAVTAARADAQTLFSYDYRRIGADLDSARAVISGPLAREYADTSKIVGPSAVTNRAVVKADVTAVSVVSAAPGRVVVLVFLNQTVQNKNISGTRLDQNRVRLTMVRDGRRWTIERAEPL